MWHHTIYTRVWRAHRAPRVMRALSENKRKALLYLTQEPKTPYHGQTSRLPQTCVTDVVLYNRQWCFAKENTNETFKAVKIEVWLHQRLCHKQLIKKNKQTHYHQYQESSVFKAKLDENKQTKTTNKQKHTHTQNRSTFGKVQFIRRISQKNG